VYGTNACEWAKNKPKPVVSRLAQRLGKVYASTGSWYRLVRKHGWTRPRARIYPPKPKVGIRATKPNEIWHIDTSIVRLLDGSRAYLHAIIDNFSRKILAWQVNATFKTSVTAELLEEAAKGLPKPPPQVLMDSGVENINSTVTALVEKGIIARVLAQVDVLFSNSMIESWWRLLKHQWLYLNTLDSVETVRKLVEFYVDEHNKRIPHSAFKGFQTPDEMYFGKGSEVPEQLKAARLRAQQARRESNLAVRCTACQTEPKIVQLKTEQVNST
jgi:putative transposase